MLRRTPKWLIALSVAVGSPACGDDTRLLGERGSGGESGSPAGGNGGSGGPASGGTSAGGLASGGAATGGTAAGSAGSTSSGGGAGASAGAGTGGAGGSSAGAGGGQSCGTDVCGTDEFCCGPPECGFCAPAGAMPDCPGACGGGGNGGSGANGGSGGCYPGCMALPTTTTCSGSDVLWECLGELDLEPFYTNCQDLFMAFPRYCCPETFTPTCTP